MQLIKKMGSAFGRVSEAVSGARESAQQRLVVLGGMPRPSGGWWVLAALLGSFLAGWFGNQYWDATHLRQLLASEKELRIRVEAENKKLAADVEAERKAGAVAEASQAGKDKGFADVINRPGQLSACADPVGPLNQIIVEASR